MLFAPQQGGTNWTMLKANGDLEKLVILNVSPKKN